MTPSSPQTLMPSSHTSSLVHWRLNDSNLLGADWEADVMQALLGCLELGDVAHSRLGSLVSLAHLRLQVVGLLLEGLGVHGDPGSVFVGRAEALSLLSGSKGKLLAVLAVGTRLDLAVVQPILLRTALGFVLGLAILALHTHECWHESSAGVGDGVEGLHARQELVSVALVRPMLAEHCGPLEVSVSIGHELKVDHLTELLLVHEVLQHVGSVILATRAHALHVESHLDLSIVGLDLSGGLLGLRQDNLVILGVLGGVLVLHNLLHDDLLILLHLPLGLSLMDVQHTRMEKLALLLLVTGLLSVLGTQLVEVLVHHASRSSLLDTVDSLVVLLRFLLGQNIEIAVHGQASLDIPKVLPLRVVELLSTSEAQLLLWHHSISQHRNWGG
mmetsp:Transcript_5743/g.9109  ORF Transcript_5743/g.9109 Transcript_5743/m.9109 type:complete len:387 (+) Transcript_5743:234-1394(+)